MNSGVAAAPVIEPPRAQASEHPLFIQVAPLVFVFFWSTGFIGARYGLPYAEPFTYLTLRMAIAASVMVALAIILRAGWPRTLAEAGHIAVSGLLLHAGYLSFYAIIYLPVVVLFARGDREKFGRAIAGLTAIFAATYVVFVLFPVQGPRYLWPASTAIPDGVFRALTLRVLEGGSSRGTAFPSAHVAVAAMQSLFALQWHRPFGVLLSVLTALLTLGAVYGGYHYAVDVLAGAVVGLAAGLALRRAGTASAP